MRIAILGTDHAGLVTGACLADVGNDVVYVDSQPSGVRGQLQQHDSFVEPGLDALLARCRQRNLLHYSDYLPEAVIGAHVIFLITETHLSDDKQIDITDLLDLSCQLAALLTKETIIVVQSSVPPGTCERIQNIFDSLSPPTLQRHIHVVYIPTFHAEGNAITGFQAPSKIVIGTSHSPTQDVMQALYAPFTKTGGHFLVMDWLSAEFSKYAYSAVQAARISVMNELACIAGQVNADISAVSQVLAQDTRIGGQNLQASAGYGGTTLPTHVQSLIQMAQSVDEPAYILRSLERVNHRQTRLLFETISGYFKHVLRGRCLAVWGLASAADTDDINQSPSLILIRALLAAGARVQAYDPVAAKNAATAISNNRLTLAASAEAACQGADALIVMTQCEEFLHPDFNQVAQYLRTPALFDAHNIYKASTLERYRLRRYHLWQKRTIPRRPVTH